MGWWHDQQQQQAQQKAAADKAAAEQAKKDQEAAARQQLTDSWKDLYNSGGDLAVAESILSGQANGGTYTQQDLAAAKEVKEGGKTFKQVGAERLQGSYDTWWMVTGSGKNNTRYGAQGQTIHQVMPWDEWSKDIQTFDWSDGSYDERIKSEKAAADKAAADKAAADKAAADEAARLAEEQRQADALAKQQADAEAKRLADAEAKRLADEEAKRLAEENKPKVEVEETPSSIAKERTETYTNENGSTITNNIEQNIGNRGDTKTTVGDDNTINNSEIGDNKSQNIGEINVENEQQAWSNDDFVWSLAKEKADAYRSNANDRVKNGNKTITNKSTINNNFFQNTGNKGDWSTTVGNNNKMNNVKAGNDYSINLGNINNSNSNKWSM